MSSNAKKLALALAATVLLNFSCKINKVEQPAYANPGEIIEIKVHISDEIDETTNPHKGVLCVLVPDDWQYLDGSYQSVVGSGEMIYSSEWSDSAEACKPSFEFGENMNWVALISDTGYTYTNNPSVEISTRWKVGNREGCFTLAYLATKATRDLICTGWSPFSFPHYIGIPVPCDTAEALQAEPAPQWSELFHRHDGWTGSDAVYSIPLSGIDFPSSLQAEKTIFVFGDTFIGQVNENDERKNSRMIRNTMALLQGKNPFPDSIHFYWDTTSTGEPTALWHADTPQSNSGDWIWPMDGISLNGKIYVFGLRLDSANNFFRIVGTTLISFELDSSNQIENYTHRDAPLYLKTDDGELVLGQAVMPMTIASGNPDPDGYIYVYGPKNSFGSKGLIASRVAESNFEEFSSWEFWTGNGWSPNIQDCAIITTGISQEFSLSPLKDGRFLLVFESGGKVKIKFGESPVGPFQAELPVYIPPEPQIYPSAFVYNAKAHPHLSTEDEMLISYNVNTFSLYDLMHYADIYRPRFVRLRLFSSGTGINRLERSVSPESFMMIKNFPNPFNNSTVIEFRLVREGLVSVEIFDLLGESVSVLLKDSRKSVGVHQVRWNGKDEAGIFLPSGIYLCQIRTEQGNFSEKMLLLR